MCLEYVKDKRIVALWFSGFFGANAVVRAVLLLLGIEVTIPKIGVTLTTEINVISFIVTLIISILLGYWACKQLKPG
jgi:protein-S-isoprenylcysteine O-methyltransferase Ste14